MKISFCLIRPQNFEQEVILERKPVLLLCMPDDSEFPGQLKVLNDVGVSWDRELKICLLEEEFIDSFKQSLRIGGTPTFIILVEGRERNRMLGLADRDSLADFISSTLDLIKNGATGSQDSKS